MLVNVAQFGVLGAVVAILASIASSGGTLLTALRPKAAVINTCSRERGWSVKISSSAQKSAKVWPKHPLKGWRNDALELVCSALLGRFVLDEKMPVSPRAQMMSFGFSTEFLSMQS